MNTNPKSIQSGMRNAKSGILAAAFRTLHSALRTLFLLVLVLVLELTSRAQTSTNTPPTIPGISSTVSQWFTSQNTNLTWQDVTIWDGPIYLNNVNVANEFGGSCDLWRSGTNANSILFAAIEGRTRQSGIAGTFVSQNAGAELGWMKYDVRLGAFLDGVYRNNITIGDAHARLGVELGLFADKKLSQNTGLGFFISYQSGQQYPLIGGQLNVSFGNGNGFLGLF